MLKQNDRIPRFFQIVRTARNVSRIAIVVFLTLSVWPTSEAKAQQRSRYAVEGFAGWAGFVDNSTKHHGAFGGAARFYITPRLALGPEFTYMRGPGTDRDAMLTGNLTFDLRRSLAESRSRLNPYLVVGAGLFQSRGDASGANFRSTEGSFTAGGGLRVFLTDRVYVAPEVRVGWELHLRTSIAVGYQF